MRKCGLGPEDCFPVWTCSTVWLKTVLDYFTTWPGKGTFGKSYLNWSWNFQIKSYEHLKQYNFFGNHFCDWHPSPPDIFTDELLICQQVFCKYLLANEEKCRKKAAFYSPFLLFSAFFKILNNLEDHLILKITQDYSKLLQITKDDRKRIKMIQNQFWWL